MACSSCGSDNLVDARFCANCGLPLEEDVRTDVAPLTCPECGHDNPAEAVFCATCGNALDAAVAVPTSAPPLTPQSGVGSPAAPGVQRPRKWTSFGYWAYSGLAIVIAVVTLLVMAGTYGALPILAALGACLWVGVTGKWPGTQRAVNSMVRVILGLIPISLNGLAGFGLAALILYPYFYPDDYPDAAAGFVGVFLVALLLEVLAVLLVLGVGKLTLHLWRRARRDDPASERYRDRREYALP